MTTLQARKSLAPPTYPRHGLRIYPSNSPHAKARLIVLALLADGRLDKRELEGLERRGVYAALGLSREDFVSVLYDFCSDAAQLPRQNGNHVLSPAALDCLLEEIEGPLARKDLVRMIIAVVCSDGKLAEGEKRLLWNAIDAWRLPIADSARHKASPPAPAGGAEHYFV